MNSRRFMSGPKHRRHHLIGSNEHFDRGLETRIKTIAAAHSQCRRWVIRDGVEPTASPAMSHMPRKRN
jgi:hypothetical protein